MNFNMFLPGLEDVQVTKMEFMRFRAKILLTHKYKKIGYHVG